MNILFKYISVNFIRFFLICVFSFLFVYLAVDAMSKLPRLSERGVPTDEILKYFIYKMPLILTQITPMATLLATLLTLGILARNSEITAMKACGISIFHISIPILILSLLISLFSLFTNEYLVPQANKKYKKIERIRDGRYRTQRLFKRNNIWYFGEENIYNIELLDVKNKSLRGVTIYKMKENFKVSERIDTKEVKWVDKGWLLKEGIIRKFNSGLKVEEFKEKKIPLKEVFGDFTVISQTPEEMGFKELKKHIEKLDKMGLDSTRFVVDLLAKIAFPLVNFILPLIGIPYALKTGRSSGIAAGVGLSIVIGFAYWIIMAFNVSLGHVGALPPFLAAFGSNIIFALIGIISIMRVKS